MFYYRVLFPLAIDRGFVYKSDRHIELGSRVLVDFKGRQRIGIVWSDSEKPDYNAKPILDVPDDKPVITKELLNTLKFFSFYFLSKEGLFLKSALPKKLFGVKNGIDLEVENSNPVFNKRPFELSKEQKNIIQSIKLNEFSVNLIFGVTGSGKTEVYLSLIEEVLKNGKKSVVLVPEIALTPQYIEVFSFRFSHEFLSIIHSRLTPKQKFDNWLAFNKGLKPILIGTRSAIFSNFTDVGLVVVDEENDESYKQDSQPLYNAKDIAIYRAKQIGIPVILSSATPLLEDYYKAKTGKFRLFEMKKRVGKTKLPDVEFVRLESGEIFAQDTLDAIENTLKNNKTVAVLINRRGFSNYLVCGDCGYVFLCPNCSVSLKFHKSENTLKCHWCDSSFEVFDKCPKCGSPNVLQRGVGSQMVEEVLSLKFPDSKIERFDRDSTSRKGAFERIVNDLRAGKIDILIGTQMLSKGHDISQIGLVVVVDFESLFVMPDFRAEERAVSLIMQTAGRSGRKEPGRVIIQLSSEDNPFVEFIKRHDFKGFAEEELKLREALSYPPFKRIIRVISESTSKEKSYELINFAKDKLSKRLNLLGPSKCPIFKLRNKYRYHIIIKSLSIVNDISFIKEQLYSKEGLYFDVDPISFF
ncbi:replication restart helicase PriA [Hippea maritima]|uniref:Replication restart protein PriA n=1 Tax=Hippea maritima (strain ATCC 700847 / DSM 10411 / MH2) TaxID=760142 RepID=F2LTH3_HIPMA|nr:primosomal protein N' [Hippea maritima]AEA33298.1 primosomal protein N' [Hippea maritima DSM 10411]